jgi:hypothetical protein
MSEFVPNGLMTFWLALQTSKFQPQSRDLVDEMKE